MPSSASAPKALSHFIQPIRADQTNEVVGLYEAGQIANNPGNPENPDDTTVGVLIDYTATADTNGLFTIVENLAPGTYWLSGSGTVPPATFPLFKSVVVTGSVPALDAQQLTFEPGTGLTSVPEYTIIDDGQSDINTDSGLYDATFQNQRYQTDYFSVTIPANTNGSPITVTVGDNDTLNAAITNSDGQGFIQVAIWELVNGAYTQLAVGQVSDNLNPTIDAASLTPSDTPVAGAQYFVSINFYDYQGAAYVGVNVPIVATGLPDLDVSPIILTPANGKTHVQSAITDESYIASPTVPYFFGLGEVDGSYQLPAMTPFESIPLSLTAVPSEIGDNAQVVVDGENTIAELSKTNNHALANLIDVDHNAPSAEIGLSDPNMTAESPSTLSTGGGTWGRYISGTKGQTTNMIVSAADADGDLYEVNLTGPTAGSSTPAFYNDYIIGQGEVQLDGGDIHPGRFRQAQANQPNQLERDYVLRG